MGDKKNPKAWKKTGYEAPEIDEDDDEALEKFKGTVLQDKREVFDQNVFEFASVVMDEEDEVLGFIVYGISARPLETAIADAKAQAREQLITTLGILGLVAGAVHNYGHAVAAKDRNQDYRAVGDPDQGGQGDRWR